MEVGRHLPSRAPIHMQAIKRQLPMRVQGSFSRSFPSPGRHVSSAVQSYLNFLGACLSRVGFSRFDIANRMFLCFFPIKAAIVGSAR